MVNPKYFDRLDTNSLTDFINTLIESSQRMQQMLETETKTIQSKTLVDSLKEYLCAATLFNMKLFERNRPVDNGKTEGNLAQKMQKELVDKFPMVSSRCISFRQPIQHMIAEMNFTYTNNSIHNYLFFNRDICRLLDVGLDLDATDRDGNTLLLFVAKMVASEFFPRKLYDDAAYMLNYYIDQGAYIYARNTEGKSVMEYLESQWLKDRRIAGVLGILDNLKSKVPSLQSLAAMNAKGVKSAGHIPEQIQAFLDLH